MNGDVDSAVGINSSGSHDGNDASCYGTSNKGQGSGGTINVVGSRFVSKHLGCISYEWIKDIWEVDHEVVSDSKSSW